MILVVTDFVYSLFLILYVSLFPLELALGVKVQLGAMVHTCSPSTV